MEKISLSELPVLDDFTLFLTFLKSHDKVPVSATTTHLKPADLYRINEELHFKAPWATSRTLQPHYPALHFFHEAVQVLDLARVHFEAKGAFLRIEPEQVDRYELMTRAEQYFSLLRAAWCLVSWGELAGVRSLYFQEDVMNLLRLVAESSSGQAYEVEDRRLVLPPDEQRIFLVGSMKIIELFWFLGFYDLERDPTLTKRPESHIFPYRRIVVRELSRHLVPVLLEHRPFEHWHEADDLDEDSFFAFLQLLEDALEENKELTIPEELEEEEMPDEPFIRAFQPLFAPGELEEELPLAEEAVAEGCYTLKVSLDKKLYRTFEIGASATLEELHLAIQEAYQFDDDHLYAFFMDNKAWSRNGIYDPRGDRAPFADDVQLGELDLYPGMRFLYLFDFGDCWQFEIDVLGFDPEAPEPEEARLVEAKGEAPDQYGYEEEEDEDWE